VQVSFRMFTFHADTEADKERVLYSNWNGA
jgi:hypothetical protein